MSSELDRGGGDFMDWDKLRIFQAVADAGSFTHAGESLKLSQSAISRQIGALEEQLGVMLFHRHARGLILTEQGDLLYRTAHDVFMKLEAARAKLTDSRERPHGARHGGQGQRCRGAPARQPGQARRPPQDPRHRGLRLDLAHHADA